MKKILAGLATITLCSTGGSMTVACMEEAPKISGVFLDNNKDVDFTILSRETVTAKDFQLQEQNNDRSWTTIKTQWQINQAAIHTGPGQGYVAHSLTPLSLDTHQHYQILLFAKYHYDVSALYNHSKTKI